MATSAKLESVAANLRTITFRNLHNKPGNYYQTKPKVASIINNYKKKKVLLVFMRKMNLLHPFIHSLIN
jgi:hypothetical protein